MHSKNSKNGSRASPNGAPPQRRLPDRAQRHEGPFRAVTLTSVAGPVFSHYYAARDATRAVIWVGGIVGGFDSPARGLYPDLAKRLLTHNVASLRIRLRWPGWVPSSVSDVRAGIRFLRRQGIQHIALVGHSIGSAVVLQAARIERRSVRAVVSLSSLHVGAKVLEGLGPRCACLFVHGQKDAILPSWFSERLHERAVEPKRLLLLPRAGHRLSESRSAVRREILSWLENYLTEDARSTNVKQPRRLSLPSLAPSCRAASRHSRSR